MFVYGPALMCQAGWIESVWALLTGTVGVLVLAGGIQGWLFGTVGWPVRAALVVAALLLIKPGICTDLAGMAILGGVLAYQRLARRTVPAGPAAEPPA